MSSQLKKPSRWLAVAVGLMAGVLIFGASAEAEKQEGVPAKLPVVEKKEHKDYTEGIKDTKLKFDMVAIPGGTYLIGSPPSEKGRDDDEGPQRPVKVSPFWMGKVEVTWDEFDIYWKEDNSGQIRETGKPDPKNADAITRPTPPYADETFGHGRENHPVLCITHHAAMEYCRWLSEKTGRQYRLPTEAEWEWACRAGTTTAYYWGDNPSGIKDHEWYLDNAEDETQEVAGKKPNPWGLYDMLGNVSEWCIEHYRKDYSQFPADAVTINPVLIPTNKRFSHVARGGSWADPPEMCRSASRQGSDPSWIQLDPQRPQSIWWLTSAEHVGFRVVRAVEENPKLKNIRSKVTRESPNE